MVISFLRVYLSICEGGINTHNTDSYNPPGTRSSVRMGPSLLSNLTTHGCIKLILNDNETSVQ